MEEASIKLEGVESSTTPAKLSKQCQTGLFFLLCGIKKRFSERRRDFKMVGVNWIGGEEQKY